MWPVEDRVPALLQKMQFEECDFCGRFINIRTYLLDRRPHCGNIKPERSIERRR